MKSIKNIVLFIISFVIILLIGELYLQTAEINALSVTRNDMKLGSALKPNKKLIFFNEGFYIGGVNGYGYYGPGYPPDKEINTLRIALIGDSYVEAHQLFDRQSMRALIEKELGKRLKKKVEVLNFGMSGFNLNDDYCYYHNFVKTFYPDVSLFFVSDEDFDTQRTSLRRPLCYLDSSRLEINYDFRENPDFKQRIKTQWYRGKSILLGWFYKSREIIQNKLWQPIVFDKFYVWFSENNIVKENDEENRNPKLQPVTIRIINTIEDEPGAYFVAKEPLSESIARLITKQKIIQPDSVYLSKYHYWKTTGTYGHWNEEAHKMVAHSVSDFLTRQLKNTNQ